MIHYIINDINNIYLQLSLAQYQVIVCICGHFISIPIPGTKLQYQRTWVGHLYPGTKLQCTYVGHLQPDTKLQCTSSLAWYQVTVYMCRSRLQLPSQRETQIIFRLVQSYQYSYIDSSSLAWYKVSAYVWLYWCIHVLSYRVHLWFQIMM